MKKLIRRKQKKAMTNLVKSQVEFIVFDLNLTDTVIKNYIQNDLMILQEIQNESNISN